MAAVIEQKKKKDITWMRMILSIFQQLDMNTSILMENIGSMSKKCLAENNYVYSDNLNVKVVTEKIVAFRPVTTGTPT